VEPGAVAALLRTAGADLLIHGHTHRPAEHRLTVDGRACTRVVLPDWYEGGGYLGLDDAGNYTVATLAAGTPE
jgi:UDP-2,3-diacylglucosamine hydrolase